MRRKSVSCHIYVILVCLGASCVMVCLCPDVSHVVSVVSPEKVHWQTVKWILCYLWGATSVGSIFDRGSGIGSNVIGYVDSDYVSDLVVTRGNIALKNIVSEKILVDMMTKPVLIFKFKRCLDLSIVCSLWLPFKALEES